jgi:phage gp45-like
MQERIIGRMLAPLQRAIANMAARATVALVNSAGRIQRVQMRLLNGEAKQSLDHFEAYGLALFLAGDRSHGVVICIGDRRYRLTSLAPGEVALHDDLGQKVHLTRTGMQIHTPLDIDLRGANVRIHGNESLIIECNGHGEKWLPTHKESWTIGATGSSHNINPPDIP